MKKKVEDPSLLIDNGFGKNHNNIKKKRLKFGQALAFLWNHSKKLFLKRYYHINYHFNVVDTQFNPFAASGHHAPYRFLKTGVERSYTLKSGTSNKSRAFGYFHK